MSSLVIIKTTLISNYKVLLLYATAKHRLVSALKL